jgi:hypothetical protein
MVAFLMRILIGGSPSTGSSLFRQMLNRHPEIFCGPESYLFIYPRLYDQWERYRCSIYTKYARRALKAPGMFLQSGVRLNSPELGNRSRTGVRELVYASGAFPEFCDRFFQEILIEKGKTHWAEKSPANALCFTNFLEGFESAHVIHIIRDPFDTITSLLKRGESLYLAAALYLLQSAAALRSRHSQSYHQIRYEELVAGPEEALKGLLEEMKLTYEPTMLETGNPGMTEISQMPGWQFDETASPSAEGIGRFLTLSDQEKEAIRYAMQHLVIDESFAAEHGIEHTSFESLLEAIDYPGGSKPAGDRANAFDNLLNKGKRHFKRQCLITGHWQQLRRSPVRIV